MSVGWTFEASKALAGQTWGQRGVDSRDINCSDEHVMLAVVVALLLSSSIGEQWANRYFGDTLQ